MIKQILDILKLNLNTTTVDYESITVSATVASLSAVKARMYKNAYITVEAAPIRIRLDGNSPTSTEGHYIAPGDIITLQDDHELLYFKAIRDSSASVDAKLRVSYGALRS